MTTRAQFRDTVLLKTPNGTVIVPLSSSAAVYDVGTTNPIVDTLYADHASGVLLPNPIPVGSDGAIQFWTLNQRELDVVVTTPGYLPVRTTGVTLAAAAVGWWS